MTSASASAVVFSSDEAYAHLARGLVMSLSELGFPSSDIRLILIDIGCGPDTLAFMRSRGVEVVGFDAALIPEAVMAVISSAQRAQVIRPWLPDLLPDCEHLIWLDCDLWLQNSEVLQHLRAGAMVSPNAVMLAPAISQYSQRFFRNMDDNAALQRAWYTTTYEPDFAEEISKTMHYSSGVFGLLRSSPVWALWRTEIEQVYPRIAARNSRMVHLAEQIALNAVVFRSGLIVRLDPLFNFHCNTGGAMRAPNGRVMTYAMVPLREIGVVHLAAWSLLRQQYFAHKLLYRSGDYLSPAELSAINAPV